jgi:hypothetical protein
MVWEPPPRPGEPPEWVPVQEKLSPNLPPDLPYTKEKRPPEWRWLGEPAPGSVPLPKDLSDIVLIRQIGAQLTTAADRQDSTATPARAEGVACTSVTDFLDTFFSPGPFDLPLLCCPVPKEDRLKEFEAEKQEVIKACTDSIQRWRNYLQARGQPEAAVLRFMKTAVDWARERLEKLLDEELKKAGDDEEQQKKMRDLYKKNTAKFEQDALRTCIGIVARRLVGKTVHYVPHEQQLVPYFPGFQHPGVPRGEDPGEKSEKEKGPHCPSHPEGEPVAEQCPEYDSPYLGTAGPDREFLDKLVTAVINCDQPTEVWRTDCVRIATFSWIIAGYCLYGDDFLKKYPDQRITFGPFTGKGQGDRHDVADWHVWPLDKDHILQYGQDTDDEGKRIGPKEGDIVWFGDTAAVCLGEINGVPRYLVPLGAGVIVLQGKTEAETEEHWAMRGGVRPRPLVR